VVDASVALAWCFEDEASADTEALLDRARLGSIVVPSLFPIELANGWQIALRRRRIDEDRVAAYRSTFGTMRMTVDLETAHRAWTDVLPLARREALTAYDACYLELALRRRLPLATRDVALARAAGRNGVDLL
jgi:predicted nucleic acid-binding protein